MRRKFHSFDENRDFRVIRPHLRIRQMDHLNNGERAKWRRARKLIDELLELGTTDVEIAGAIDVPVAVLREYLYE